MLRTAELLPPKGLLRRGSTRPVSRPNRQPATAPPGSYSYGTHTRWRRRAYVGSATQTAPPTLGARMIRVRLPLRGPADRAGLSLLRGRDDPAAAMHFIPDS